MNLGVTIARKGDKWEVVTDPNVPFSTQRREFTEVVKTLEETHDEVQLISSSMGRVRRKKIRGGGKVASAAELTVPKDDESDEDQSAPETKVEAPAVKSEPKADNNELI